MYDHEGFVIHGVEAVAIGIVTILRALLSALTIRQPTDRCLECGTVPPPQAFSHSCYS